MEDRRPISAVENRDSCEIGEAGGGGRPCPRRSPFIQMPIHESARSMPARSPSVTARSSMGIEAEP